MPGPPQRHRTRQSWNTSRNYSRAATRHAPLRKEDPGLWRDLVKNIDSPSSQSDYLRRLSFFFLAQQRLLISNAPAPPNSMPQLRLQTAAMRNPKLPGLPTPFRPPNRSLGILVLLQACLEQPGFAAQGTPLKWSSSYERHSRK